MRRPKPWPSSAREEAAQLEETYRKARRAGNREEEERCRKALVRHYVYFGEHYKLSDRPSPAEAKYWLRKALKLGGRHPLANYRDAHLLYRENEYEQAAWHFRKALDGTPEEGLNDSQALVAHAVLVNCGLLMANEALREVHFARDNAFRDLDAGLVDEYCKKMLVDNEEMLSRSENLLERLMYKRETPAGHHVCAACPQQRRAALAERRQAGMPHRPAQAVSMPPPERGPVPLADGLHPRVPAMNCFRYAAGARPVFCLKQRVK